MIKKLLPLLAIAAILHSCKKEDFNSGSETEIVASRQESITFSTLSTINVGGEGAAEISAYDPITMKLFVVNNSAGNSRIDVFSIENPSAPIFLTSIQTAALGGYVNSVSVKDGKLAAAIEASVKTNSGKAVIYNTADYSMIAEVQVGALPDMITFTPDGKYILTANEGEPNDAYTIDPEGTVSIIDVANNYSVINLGFSGFSHMEASLKANGFRIFGPNASFAQDIEPEYIAVSGNSKQAWVTLQENNGIAVIDLNSKTITDIFPLGSKDYNTAANSMDMSDQDGGVFFNPKKVKGLFMPDGITVVPNGNIPFVFSANEGDAREYSGYSEIKRLGSNSVILDPLSFPDVATLKQPSVLGRLNITTANGDTDMDGDLDELYSYGARSFSIWNGNTGEMVYDSKNMIDRIAYEAGVYPDNRSDDKGCEPEGIISGRVGNRNLLFVGLERANAIMVFDITNPVKPAYLQLLNTGNAPEGILFVDAAASPNGKSLLISSNEGSGSINIFTTN